MHICDCKGVSAHLLGSGLWQLALEGHQHIQGSQDERVRLLWVAIQRIYLEQKVESKMFKLTKEMIYSGPQNWAMLPSNVKAATTRALVPVVRQTLQGTPYKISSVHAQDYCISGHGEILQNP